ncbi:hypothetical protein [Achromobacter phage SE2]|nr:hypothetical protein [Achromobacter phage SE2]
MSKINLNHPNWSGKSYRSSDEAFGTSNLYLTPKQVNKFSRENPLTWFLGVLLLILLVALCFLPINAKASEIEEIGGIDYVQRSLDKVIVVTPTKTFSLPAPRGSGQTYVHISVERVKDRKLDYGPGYRNDACAQSGTYCGNLRPVGLDRHEVK